MSIAHRTVLPIQNASPTLAARPCVLAGDCEVSICVVPLEADALVVRSIRPRPVQIERSAGSCCCIPPACSRPLLNTLVNPSCHRLPVVADHLRTMASGIEPQQSIIRHSARWRHLRQLDQVRRAAIRISVRLNAGRERSTALCSAQPRTGLNYADVPHCPVLFLKPPVFPSTCTLVLNSFRLEVKPLQPVRPIAHIADVIRNRKRRPQTDADMGWISVTPVVSNKRVISIVSLDGC